MNQEISDLLQNNTDLHQYIGNANRMHIEHAALKGMVYITFFECSESVNNAIKDQMRYLLGLNGYNNIFFIPAQVLGKLSDTKCFVFGKYIK
ncbi:MAG: hypothetical protein ACMXYG_01285 [Candidatus Woesearchaeota archaeon]